MTIAELLIDLSRANTSNEDCICAVQRFTGLPRDEARLKTIREICLLHFDKRLFFKAAN